VRHRFSQLAPLNLLLQLLTCSICPPAIYLDQSTTSGQPKRNASRIPFQYLTGICSGPPFQFHKHSTTSDFTNAYIPSSHTVTGSTNSLQHPYATLSKHGAHTDHLTSSLPTPLSHMQHAHDRRCTVFHACSPVSTFHTKSKTIDPPDCRIKILSN
jgi:hypothetical protein